MKRMWYKVCTEHLNLILFGKSDLTMMRCSLLLFFMLTIASIANAQQAKPVLVLPADAQGVIKYTPEALKVINNKCMSCHTPSSKDEDAKEALIWEETFNYNKKLALLTLDDILESLEKGEMPPKETVQKTPSAALTTAEAVTLKAWVESSLTKLE